MRTDYELVNALRAMYCFLGGNGCMQCSSDSIKLHFNCGFSSDNKVLIDAIVKAATGQRKQVSCEYSGSVVNIKVTF